MVNARIHKLFTFSIFSMIFSVSFILDLSPLVDKTTPQTGAGAVPAAALMKRSPVRHWKSSSLSQGGDAMQSAPKLRTGLAASGASQTADILPENFQGFVDSVENGNAREVRGVYVSGVFALPVIQQPDNDPIFVSSEWDEVTEFRNARRNGVTGLLAHNFLSGKDFYDIEVGQDLWIVLGNGELRRYRVSTIDQYQKITPESVQSELVDLGSGKRLTTAQVFNRHYSGGDKVTLQTCLEKDGLLNWGLSFWTAVPVN